MYRWVFGGGGEKNRAISGSGVRGGNDAVPGKSGGGGEVKDGWYRAMKIESGNKRRPRKIFTIDNATRGSKKYA